MLFTNTNLPARLLLIGCAIFSLQGCQTPDPCAEAYEEGDRPYMRCQQAHREHQKTMDKALADARREEAQRQAAYDASSEGQAKKQAERRLVESIQNLTQSVQTAGNQVAARRAEQARQQQALADNQARAQAEQQRQAQQQAQLVAEQQANADNQRRLIREQEIRNTVSTRPVEVADIAGTQSGQAPDLRKLASSRPGMAAPPAQTTRSNNEPKSPTVNECVSLSRGKYNHIKLTNRCDFTISYSYCLRATPDNIFACKDIVNGEGEGTDELGAGLTTPWGLPESAKATGIQWIACRGSLGEVLPMYNRNGKHGCY